MSKPSVTRMACARIPTEFGDFQLCYYNNSFDTKEHLALVMGDVAKGGPVLARVHSECFTGDVLGSRRCDCGEQLKRSLELVAREGLGVVLYMRQEGRGIGLLEKLRAYNLQDQGYDTVDANLMLGHGADERDYTLAACMLEDLGVKSVRLMTNNPSKIAALKDGGIEIAERVPLEIPPNTDNADYLLTKVKRMDHQLRVNPLSAANSEKHEPQSTN
jgi:GTP cyclohydrolase II